jgi:hypothetical protein
MGSITTAHAGYKIDQSIAHTVTDYAINLQILLYFPQFLRVKLTRAARRKK